jgi:heme exporter protein A
VTHTTLAGEGLQLWRGERHVLRGVSFALQAGQALHVCGPNGAGKTTLLRVACGLLHPEEGAVTWKGGDIRAAGSVFLSALAYLGHEPALKGDLTAVENLRFDIGLRHAVRDGALHATLAELGVPDCADLPCRVLSAGQRRRVALARVLLTDAPLWILDEPFTNLDVASSERISAALAAHLRRGGCALVAAHQGLNLPAGVVTRLELQ